MTNKNESKDSIITVHTNKYLQSLCEMQMQLVNRLNELKPLVSFYDKKQDQVLHLLELETLDSEQEKRVIKMLIKIRHERRNVKQEVIDINCALRGFSFQPTAQPSCEIPLSYRYDSEMMQEIFENTRENGE